jgi:hypothetical protein
MRDRKHVTNIWFEHEEENGRLRRVCVVETDLQTDPLQDDYDTSEMDDLLHDATEWFKQHAITIDVVRVVPKGWRNG